VTQPQPSVDPASSEEHGNLPAVIALVLASVGAVLAILVVVVPGMLLLTYVPLLTAFGLALVGLNRTAGRSMALAALIISLVFCAMGPILFFGRDLNNTPVQPPATIAPDLSKAIQPGLKVVNVNGVELTMKSVSCGDRKFANTAGTRTKAKGRFCVVKVKVKNGSADAVTLGMTDVTGLIDVAYPATAMSGELGADTGLATLAPGVAVTAAFAIDVPKKARLEYVVLRPTWPLQDAVVVKAK
jgi:hypothetical protein